MLDPIAIERAEKSLDEFINSRSKAKDKANELEAMYAETTRRHHEKRREEHRLAWYCYHLDTAERLRRTMTALVEKHEAAAASLLKELPKGET